MVVALREWAQKTLSEETQRPDSFLERFRGPADMDIQEPAGTFRPCHSGSGADDKDGPSRHKTNMY